MNFLRTLFGIVSILFYVQKISAEIYNVIRDKYEGPLAVLKEEADPTLKIALPLNVNRRDVAGYFTDKKGEHGPAQEFKTACPSFTPEQKKIETEWRRKVKAAEDSTLYFLQDYTGEDMKCSIDYYKPVPSINKTNQKCANSQGDIYQIGYPVSKSDEKDVDFMTVYKICHSKNRGTIYTAHRIDSPELLLLKVNELYEPTVFTSFKSALDPELEYVFSYYRNGNVHQFVPAYDMPTVLWENTTLFPFNYSSFGENFEIYRSVMKFNNFIRLFSKKTKKPLTIFSGVFETELTWPNTGASALFKKTKKIPIRSFWKVILDNNNKATILVTQYTKKACGTIAPYMCGKNDEHFIKMKNYFEGGCIYKCSVSPELLQSLQLPDLQISGNLDISYTAEQPLQENSGEKSDADAQFSSRLINITDFADARTFSDTLIALDPVTAAAMTAEGALGAKANGANQDGGDREGDGPEEWPTIVV